MNLNRAQSDGFFDAKDGFFDELLHLAAPPYTVPRATAGRVCGPSGSGRRSRTAAGVTRRAREYSSEYKLLCMRTLGSWVVELVYDIGPIVKTCFLIPRRITP